ncbi:MAG: TIGR02281 family clan AA aspartic protease [Silicimonas sp.]|nr:TIGR02281 family clan AA aspartic protease [Silicimonas sp.]
MDSQDLPRLIYLVLLLTAVGGWFIAENRQSLGKTARMLLAWGLIFLGVIAGYGLWEDVRRDIAPRQSVLTDGATIMVPRGPGGHFFLTVDVNGTPVDFIVDTGATDVVLTLDDARRIGLDPDTMPFLGSARTANGSVKTAFATVDSMSLGPLRYDGVRVAVNGGEMEDSLLGMTFLSRFEKLEITNDRLTLIP